MSWRGVSAEYLSKMQQMVFGTCSYKPIEIASVIVLVN